MLVEETKMKKNKEEKWLKWPGLLVTNHNICATDCELVMNVV